MRLQVIDPTVNFSCSGCAHCCEQPWHTTIETERLPAIDAVDWGAEFPALAGKTLYRTVRENGKTVHQLAKGEGVRCIFLDADNLCMIHKKLGFAAKPHMCQQFPFIPARAWDADYVSANYGCKAVQEQHGKRMTEQADEIAATVRISQRPANAEAPIPLTPTVSVRQPAARALMNAIGEHFVDPTAGTIVDRFAAAMHVLDRAVSLGPAGAADAIEAGELRPERPVESVSSLDTPAAAPMASRFLFAATLFPDTLPPDTRDKLGFIGRLSLVPKLMALAKMRGVYPSRLLGRNVKIEDVMDESTARPMSDEATALLGRYLQSRMWQQFPGGTQLPVVSAMHQHILDVCAVTFYARAEVRETGAEALTLPIIQKALMLVEFHLANQSRLYTQVLRGWLKTNLSASPLAWASLRMIRLRKPVTAAVTNADV